jgi:thymidylate synthase
MKTYIDLLNLVHDTGLVREYHEGITARSLFGQQLRHNFDDGFPLLTTRTIDYKPIIGDIIQTIQYNQPFEACASRWNGWLSYGSETDDSPYTIHVTNQINDLFKNLMENPKSCRNILLSYVPGEALYKEKVVDTCLVQFYLANGKLFRETSNKLSCQVYLRKADLLNDVPLYLAFYGFMMVLIHHIIKIQYENLKLGELILTFGDVHLNTNEGDRIREQSRREPKNLPNVYIGENIANVKHLKSLIIDDFIVEKYFPKPSF